LEDKHWTQNDTLKVSTVQEMPGLPGLKCDPPLWNPDNMHGIEALIPDLKHFSSAHFTALF
jgi:hypothetical protein